MKNFFWLACLAFCFHDAAAQYTGVHHEEQQKYQAAGKTWQQYEQENMPASGIKSQSTCSLNSIVFGWHPYWSNGLQVNYDWNLLSDFSYFSYEVDPATGNALNTHGWSSAASVTTALANGKRVNLCVTLFSSHATFFGSASAQQTLISNLISLVQSRGAHGVNIDFEGVPAAQKNNFTSFMSNLASQMHTSIPGSQVSMALYAVDWNGVFDMPVLNQFVDLFIIMGYDYYWSGSTTAGPNDPLYHYGSTYNYTLSRSITYYLDQGASESKLVLGLPWYGREYTCTSSAFQSAVLNPPNSVTRTYKTVRDNISGNYSSTNYQWDPASYSGAYIFNTGNWKQCFIDSYYGYANRFDLVKQRGIAGIGIWALGYDDGYSDLWNLIEEKFSDCGSKPCLDTLFDMGGPLKNYYDKEDWTYTIEPQGAAQVTLNFSSFNTEANYDTLWLYNGNSVNAPLIGAYHGTSSPGMVSSSGPALTLRFKSDVATTNPGWLAYQGCVIDTIRPLTTIQPVGGWITGPASVTFADSDNLQGSGLEKAYYHIGDFNGSFWSGNPARGFLADAFDTLNAGWISQAGTWNALNGKLVQSDESGGNTNIYTALTQNLSNRYLYHWKGSIGGSGTNRRAGLHFFCDQPALPNRGNGYFVWFRLDQSALEIYKVVNDAFTLMNSEPVALLPAQAYDFKVIFDRISGVMRVYVDDVLRGSWTDPSPFNSGSHVSFRSGNSVLEVSDFTVYRSRYPQVAFSTGTTSSELRYQNPSPVTAAGRVFSIVSDSVYNLSYIDSLYLDVDWTPPADILLVNDGAGTDADTLYAQPVAGNWTGSNDAHSAVAYYEYALGNNPGDSDVVAWTQSASVNWSQVYSQLIDGNYYYQSVRAVNGAGLSSQGVTGDGFLYRDVNPGVPEGDAEQISFYPNPAQAGSEMIISYSGNLSRVFFYDASGRLVQSGQLTLDKRIKLPEVPGNYVVVLEGEGTRFSAAVVVR